MSFLKKVRQALKKEDSTASGSASTSPTVNTSNGPRANGSGPRIFPVSQETQLRLERGVKYNIKVIIRGMPRTGKSYLLSHLHGHPAPEPYRPTPTIEAATICFVPRGAPATEGAKVELWEVVDQGVLPQEDKQAKQKGFPAAMPTDASTVDVYRGCTAVIFMVDATRRETLSYVAEQAGKVPPTTAVLVCLNYYDAPDAERVVSDREVDDLCQCLRSATTPLITQAANGNPPHRDLCVSTSWAPTCMLSGMGLDSVRSFLEIPVALVRLETLESQMRSIFRGVNDIKGELLTNRAQQLFQRKEEEQQRKEEEEEERRRLAEAEKRQRSAALNTTPPKEAEPKSAKHIEPQKPSPPAPQKSAPTAAAPKKASEPPPPPPPPPENETAEERERRELAAFLGGDDDDEAPEEEEPSEEEHFEDETPLSSSLHTTDDGVEDRHSEGPRTPRGLPSQRTPTPENNEQEEETIQKRKEEMVELPDAPLDDGDVGEDFWGGDGDDDNYHDDHGPSPAEGQAEPPEDDPALKPPLPREDKEKSEDDDEPAPKKGEVKKKGRRIPGQSPGKAASASAPAATAMALPADVVAMMAQMQAALAAEEQQAAPLPEECDIPPPPEAPEAIDNASSRSLGNASFGSGFYHARPSKRGHTSEVMEKKVKKDKKEKREKKEKKRRTNEEEGDGGDLGTW